MRAANRSPIGNISTHAPLAGRDSAVNYGQGSSGISTHAPLAGRDANFRLWIKLINKFQPTRPLRGATLQETIFDLKMEFQPTRPLRGAT